MKSLREALRLYAVVDPAMTSHEILWLVGELLSGGVRCIQYRDKVNSDINRFKIAAEMAKLCEHFDAYFFINDRVDIAMMVDADGVHVGPDDLPIKVIRSIAPTLLIGASTGSVEKALSLEKEGADYLGVGALFDARKTKANASAPRGVEIIGDIHGCVSIPLVGIGGINVENMKAVLDAGADGIATVRMLTNDTDPRANVERILKAMV